MEAAGAISHCAEHSKSNSRSADLSAGAHAARASWLGTGCATAPTLARRNADSLQRSGWSGGEPRWGGAGCLAGQLSLECSEPGLLRQSAGVLRLSPIAERFRDKAWSQLG